MIINTLSQSPTIQDGDAVLKSRFDFDDSRVGKRCVIELLIFALDTMTPDSEKSDS